MGRATFVIVGLAALSVCAATAQARAVQIQTSERAANSSDVHPAASPELSAVDHVVTAARLAEWGRSRRDPAALILAARMMSEAPLRDAALDGRSEGGAESSRTDPGQPTVEGLLAQARALSDGDGDTLAEIAAVEAAAARGVVNSAFGRGPIYAVRDIEAQATYWFELNARGGEVLRVAAVGDGDTDIDMIVRDEFGQEVCADTAYDHYPVCTFVPAFSGRFRVDIINHGRVWTRTQILSN